MSRLEPSVFDEEPNPQTRPYAEGWWVVQLANGKFFTIANPRGGTIRIGLQLGQCIGGNMKDPTTGITEFQAEKQFRDICKAKGIPIPVGYRLRQVRAEIIE